MADILLKIRSFRKGVKIMLFITVWFSLPGSYQFGANNIDIRAYTFLFAYWLFWGFKKKESNLNENE